MREPKVLDVPWWAEGAGRAPGDRGRLHGSAALDSEEQCSSEGLGNVLKGSSTLQSSTAFSLFMFIFGFRGVCTTNSARV